MNEGLAQCSYFFLFMTTESMGKAFVSLEWQAALSQAAEGGISRLVPIRASETAIPPILSHLKYIDMYTNGIDATVMAIIELVEKGSITPAINTEFRNLEARIIPVNELSLEIEISAKRFVVPHAFFAIAFIASQDVNVWIKGEPAVQRKSFKMILDKDGKQEPYSAVQVGTGKTLTPNIPVTLQVSSKGSFELHAIMHQVGENRFQGIPIQEARKT